MSGKVAWFIRSPPTGIRYVARTVARTVAYSGVQWRTGTADTAISLTKSENGQQRSVNATQYERVSRDDVKRRL